MQQVVRFLIDGDDKQRVEREARNLGLKSSGFIRLLIKLDFDGSGLERRELAIKGEKQN